LGLSECLPRSQRLCEFLVAAREEFAQCASRWPRLGASERAEQIEDQPALVEADGRGLGAETCVPTEREAGEPGGLAVEHEQAERERIRERQRLQFRGCCPSGDEVAPLDRAPEDGIRMPLARHERMFA